MKASFKHSDRAGNNRVHLSGRMAGHALTPGSYRLTATPTLDGVRGIPATTAFRIVS